MINESSSLWEQTIFAVLQASALRSILFNIILSNIFLILNNIDIASDTDDIILYKACNNVDVAVKL